MLFFSSTPAQAWRPAVGALRCKAPWRQFHTGVGAGRLLSIPVTIIPPLAPPRTLNTTGEDNTAVGVDALLNNSTGEANTTVGESTAQQHRLVNTANGALALLANTTANQHGHR